MKNFTSYLILLLLFTACSDFDQAAPDDAITSSESLKKYKGDDGGSRYTITTNPAIEITSLTATSGGNVSSGGGGNGVTEKGICYDTSPNPTTSDPKVLGGSGAGSFVCVMSDLAGSTMYYVRAYAIKKGVTQYGNQVSFTTYTDFGTVTDIDGNVYNTINIGGQVWMMENLKTTTYRDGTSIAEVTGDEAWGSLSTGAYCNYDNNASNAATYGRLYNWYAATDVHNIAPVGWHLPTNAEWTTLKNYLGGPNSAGGKAKETGFTLWESPNTAATNSSGFLARPAGARFVNCCGLTPVVFTGEGYHGDWWTSDTSSSNPDNALFVEVNYNTPYMYRSSFLGGVGYYDKRTGYSIRCVKN